MGLSAVVADALVTTIQFFARLAQQAQVAIDKLYA
jgi:hypothetical protein